MKGRKDEMGKRKNKNTKITMHINIYTIHINTFTICINACIG